MARPEASAPGHDRLAGGDRPELVALGLDRGSALGPDRPRDAGAEHEVAVRRIDDRIGGELGEIALDELEMRAADEHLNRLGGGLGAGHGR